MSGNTVNRMERHRIEPAPAFLSRRLTGAKRNLIERAKLAQEAARHAPDERAAAALRGKAQGLFEGAALLEAVRDGRKLHIPPYLRKARREQV